MYEPDNHSGTELEIEPKLTGVLLQHHCMTKLPDEPNHKKDPEAHCDPARKSVMLVDLFNEIHRSLSIQKKNRLEKIYRASRKETDLYPDKEQKFDDSVRTPDQKYHAL